jgi:hypothetical protein
VNFGWLSVPRHVAMAIAILFLASLPARAQTPDDIRVPKQSTHGPAVTVALPANVRSESIQISYQLDGYGSFLRPVVGVRAYRIFTTVNGRLPESVKIVVFTTACEPEQFEVPLSKSGNARVEFTCKPAASTLLVGRIDSPQPACHDGATVRVFYLANWADEFFGVLDGIVPQFDIGKVACSADGTFRISLPAFAADVTGREDPSTVPRAAFELALSDTRNGKPVTLSLVPKDPEFKVIFNALRVRAQYPQDLRFVTDAR